MLYQCISAVFFSVLVLTISIFYLSAIVDSLSFVTIFNLFWLYFVICDYFSFNQCFRHVFGVFLDLDCFGIFWSENP